MENLLKLYCSYHPDFLDTLDSFPENIKLKILKNLHNAENKVKFRSLIAEIQFGLKFHNLGFQLYFEKVYFTNQTPDWTISNKDSRAICEIYRLGMSLKDQIRSDFENKLIEKLQKIPFNYFIRITFFEEYFDPDFYDIDLIINDLQAWFKKSEKIVGDKIIIKNNFLFEVRKRNSNINHICCYGNANSIDIKPEKIIQFDHLNRDNEITKKISKYNRLISNTKFPYFIAVSIDFTSGFDYEDFKEYFLGKGVEFVDFDSPIANLEQFSHLGKEWTELGIFYNNPQLSGLLILERNEFKLLLNPMKNQVIYKKENESLLEKIKKIEK